MLQMVENKAKHSQDFFLSPKQTIVPLTKFFYYRLMDVLSANLKIVDASFNVHRQIKHVIMLY